MVMTIVRKKMKKMLMMAMITPSPSFGQRRTRLEKLAALMPTMVGGGIRKDSISRCHDAKSFQITIETLLSKVPVIT